MFLSCLEIQILLRQGPLFQLALTEKEFLLRNFFSLQRHVSYVTHLNTLHQTLFETPRGRLSNPRSWNSLQILVVLKMLQILLYLDLKGKLRQNGSSQFEELSLMKMPNKNRI